MAALTAVPGAALSEAGRARRGGRLPLLRPHLHDRFLPAPFGPPRIDAPGFPLRRWTGADRRPRPARSTAGPAGRRRRQGPRDPDGRAMPPAPRTIARAYRREFGLQARSTAPGAAAAGAGPQARGLLLEHGHADQRRCRAHRLLLQRPQGVLRHVLPHQPPLLREAVALALAAGCSPAHRDLVTLWVLDDRDDRPAADRSGSRHPRGLADVCARSTHRRRRDLRRRSLSASSSAPAGAWRLRRRGRGCGAAAG